MSAVEQLLHLFETDDLSLRQDSQSVENDTRTCEPLFTERKDPEKWSKLVSNYNCGTFCEINSHDTSCIGYHEKVQQSILVYFAWCDCSCSSGMLYFKIAAALSLGLNGCDKEKLTQAKYRLYHLFFYSSFVLKRTPKDKPREVKH